MNVKYNIIQKGEPGVAGGGTKKFYLIANSRGLIGIDQLTPKIAKLSTVNGADVKAVLFGLADAVPELLSEGYIVDMGDLGVFRLVLHSQGVETEEEAGPHQVKKATIHFRPSEMFKTMLKTLKYSTS